MRLQEQHHKSYLVRFHDNFPQNSFWLYDVMIALVKQPRDVCLVIILTPLSEHRNIILLSSPTVFLDVKDFWRMTR